MTRKDKTLEITVRLHVVGAYLQVFHILHQIHFITGLPLTSKSFDCSSMICNHTSVASSTKIDYKCNSTGVYFRGDGLAWNADEKGYIEKKAFFLLLPVMQFVENVNRKDFTSVCKSESPSFIYFCKSLYWIGLYILIQLLLTVELLCPSEFVNVNAIPLTIQ